MVILVDDEDSENEGDLCMAAEKITPAAINFMAKHGRGLICLSLTAERVEELGLPMMTEDNTSSFGTAFTVSIEAKKGVTTGISAADRATTILTAINPKQRLRTLHVRAISSRSGQSPVECSSGLARPKGSVDLARMAGFSPAGVICEIMNDDGTMSRVPELMEFAKQHNLKIVTIKDLIKYRTRTEHFVHRVSTTKLPTEYGGDFTAIAYSNELDSNIHIALVKGRYQVL